MLLLVAGELLLLVLAEPLTRGRLLARQGVRDVSELRPVQLQRVLHGRVGCTATERLWHLLVLLLLIEVHRVVHLVHRRRLLLLVHGVVERVLLADRRPGLAQLLACLLEEHLELAVQRDELELVRVSVIVNEVDKVLKLHALRQVDV